MNNIDFLKFIDEIIRIFISALSRPEYVEMSSSIMHLKPHGISYCKHGKVIKSTRPKNLINLGHFFL